MPRCKTHLNTATHRHAKGVVAVDYETGNAVFREDARGTFIRTTCEKCGAFIGYRPTEAKRR